MLWHAISFSSSIHPPHEHFKLVQIDRARLVCIKQLEGLSQLLLLVLAQFWLILLLRWHLIYSMSFQVTPLRPTDNSVVLTIASNLNLDHSITSGG